jgi:hypothetical protein
LSYWYFDFSHIFSIDIPIALKSKINFIRQLARARSKGIGDYIHPVAVEELKVKVEIEKKKAL